MFEELLTPVFLLGDLNEMLVCPNCSRHGFNHFLPASVFPRPAVQETKIERFFKLLIDLGGACGFAGSFPTASDICFPGFLRTEEKLADFCSLSCKTQARDHRSADSANV